MKTIIQRILVFIGLCLSTTAFAASGTSGSVSWSLNESTGVLTFSGSGEMANYRGNWNYGYTGTAPWLSYKSKITSIVINEGVTSIGAAAFYTCSKLTSISIPSTITKIYEEAFRGCSLLETITLDSLVSYIGDRWATDCPSLKTVTISSNNPYYTSIGGIVYTADMKTIVKMPDNNPTTILVIPDGITTIATDAIYSQQNVVSITIPESMTAIDFGVFDDCPNLTTLIFKANSAPVLEKNLQGTNLQYVYVPCNQSSTYQSGYWSSYASNMSESPVIDVEIGTNDYDLGDVTISQHADCDNYEMTVTAIPTSIGTFVQWADGNTENPRTYSVTVGQSYNCVAQFEKKSFQITAEQGTTMLDTISVIDAYEVLGSGTYFINDEVVLSVNILSPAYTFLQWDDGNTDNPRRFTATESKTFKALVANEVRNVSISSEGNGIVQPTMNDSLCNYGSIITMTAIPDEGYHFICWNDGNTDSVRSFVVSQDTSFSAQFAINQYTITFLNVNGDTLQSSTYNHFDIPTCTNPYKKADAAYTYQFAGWSPTITQATKNQNYIATYVKITNSYTIKAKLNNDDYGTISGTGTYNYNTYATLTVLPIENYEFIAWEDGNTENPREILVQNNETYHAIVRHVPCQVSVILDDEHSATVEGTGQCDYDSIRVIRITPNYGYEFISWEDGDISLEKTLIVTHDTTLHVHLEKKKFLLSIHSNDLTMGEGYGSGLYNYGDTVEIIAKPKKDYVFISWNETDYSTQKSIVMMQDTTIEAIFAAPTISIQAISEDTICGQTKGSGLYGYHALVQLVAATNYGYDFVGWSDGHHDNIRYFFAEEDKTVKAQYQLHTFQITATSENDKMGEIEGNGGYKYTSIATITAKPRYGYEFVSWNDGDTNQIRNIFVEQDSSFTAIFKAKTFHLITKSNDEEMGTTFGDGDYAYGTIVTLSAQANYGYELAQWSTHKSNETIEFRLTKDTSITATFQPSHFNVNVSSNDYACKVNGSGIYNYLDSVVIEAQATKGFEFLQWSDGETENPRTIMVTENCSFEAEFQRFPSKEAWSYGFENQIIIKNATDNEIYIYSKLGKLLYHNKCTQSIQTYQVEKPDTYIVRIISPEGNEKTEIVISD